MSGGLEGGSGGEDLAQCPPSQETGACIFPSTWMNIYFAVLPVAMVRPRHVLCVCSFADARLLPQRHTRTMWC